MPGPGQGHAQASPSGRGIRWPSCFISLTSATRRRFSFSFCGGEPAQFPFKAHFLSSCQYSQLMESASRRLTADEPTAELPGRRVPRRKTRNAGIRKWPRRCSHTLAKTEGGPLPRPRTAARCSCYWLLLRLLLQ